MRSTRKLTLVLVVLDCVCVFVLFNLISRARGIPQALNHVLTTPLIAPALLMIFAVYLIDGYRARTDMSNVVYTSEHVLANIAAMLATLVLTFVVIPEGFPLQSSRAVIALSFASLIPITLAYRRQIHFAYLRWEGQGSLVFLGDPASCATFREECARMRTHQPIVATVGIIPPGNHAGAVRAFPDVLREIERGALKVAAIVLRESNRELDAADSQRLVSLYFAGVPTYTLELFHEVFWRKTPLYRLNQTWLFQEGFPIAREPVFDRLKRASDILLASIGLGLSAPIILVAALAVWLEDRGPPFFRQTRIGKNQVPFRLLKLRTMRPAAVDDEPYTKTDDARVSRVGRFLRSTRIDEFPQLYNVLRNEMSLIGPRAEWDRLVGRYQIEIPCYHFRHLVKPGITGWAQVNYPYGANIDDTLRKLEYDLYYIRHFSFLLDATIVLKTIHVMLFGKGR